MKTECNLECPRLRWVFRLLVLAQFLLVGLLLIAASARQPWYSWAISMTGLAFGLWAILTMGRFLNVSPRIKQNAILRVDGPYRLVRHPMYLALLVFCLGFLVHDFTTHKLLLWLSLLGVLACKIYYEEKILRDRFPEYQQYTTKTKRVIPFVF